MPYVPKPCRESPQKPFETPPSDSPSEHATCLESHTERPFGPSLGECHVCPNTPGWENPSGCRPSSPPVPSAEAETIFPPPRMSCESATHPGAHTETLTGRLPNHPPGAFRKRHLSPSTGPSRKPPSVPSAPREIFPRMI